MRGDVLPAAGFVLMWSSGFIGAELGTAEAGATTLLMWRFLAAFALLACWWWVTGRRRISPHDIGVHAGIGLLSQGVYLLGTVLAVQWGVPAGTAALISALQPIVVVVLGQFVFGERAGRSRWVGLALGLAGVALVVGGDLAGAAAHPFTYTLPLLGMLGLVAATFAERKAAVELRLADSMLVQCGASAALFSLLAAVEGQAAPPVSGPFWGAVAWVVVLSTFGGYGFYWLNLRRGSATRVSTLLYLTPPVTMLFGYLMFGERIGVRGLLGLVVCFAAVLIVLRSPGGMSVRRVKMAPCCSTTSSPHPPNWSPPGPARPRSPCSPEC